MTLLLSRIQVERLIDEASLLDAIRIGFRERERRSTPSPVRLASSLPGPGSVMVVFPGIAAGIPAYTVKVHAKFPSSTPAIKGVLNLFDLESGELLAVMDSTLLTAVRTGLASAVATHALARENAETVAIIGAGSQGYHQLKALTLVRHLKSAKIFDIDAMRSEALAHRISSELALKVDAVGTVQAAVNGADVVVTTTWARAPFLFLDMLQAGTHVNLIGADEPGKAEAGSDLLDAATIVCDDVDLVVAGGPLAAARSTTAAAATDLTDVLNGVHIGRPSAEAITVYASVGLPFLDLVVAWSVFQRAVPLGVGTTIDFLA